MGFLRARFGGRLFALLRILSIHPREEAPFSTVLLRALCWLALSSSPGLAAFQWVLSMHLVCQTLEGPLGQKHA